MGFTPKQLRIILTVFFILFSTFFLINQINFFYHLEESVSTSSSAFFKFNRRPVSSSSSVKTIDSSNSLPNDAPAKQYEKDTTVDSFLDLHTLTIAQKHILNPRIAIIITVDNDDSSKVPYVELIDQSIYSIFDTIPEKDFNRTLSISIVYGFAMEERRKTQEMQVLERFMAKTKFPIDVTIPDPMGRGVNAHIKDTAQRIKQSIEDLERRGMKSHYEDITLMFIKAGAEIVTHGWLDIVTDTLMGLATKDANGHNDIVKPANAISFQVEGSSSNQVYSINTDSLDVKTTEISESKLQSSLSLSQNNNKSYPTSIIEGTITAMKLDTYLMLPIVNNNLGNLFVIDLEMSFNLWMCGDGIDIIPQLVARKHSKSSTSSLKGVLNESMKQLMLTWMYDHGNTQYCRDFNWFLDHINGGSKDELEHKFNDVRNKHEVLSVLSKRFDDHHDKVLINAAKKTMTNVIAISTKFDPSKRPRNMTEAELMHFFNKIPKTTKRMKKLFTIGIPHAPAIASDGTDNYIHNVTSLRSNPPELKFDNLNHVCGLHDETWKLLTKKVSVDMSGHIEAERKAKEEGIPRVKLMCIVYTIEPDHYKIPSIRETWGNKCDGFIVASNKTDPLLDTVQIQHSLDEAYNHIYQKVQAIWSYVYDHYYNDFDWFHIGGDDLYLLVENLRLYLESPEIQALSNGGQGEYQHIPKQQFPLSLGLPFSDDGGKIGFNTGGPGYTLNKAALKHLVTGSPAKDLRKKTSAEDVMISRLLGAIAYIDPIDTRDEYGDQRYHHLKPASSYSFHISEHDESRDWYTMYAKYLQKEGLDCCSRKSVAFHYINPDLMRRMHALLYGYCMGV